MAKYNVRIKTKNITYAGTDSTVAIRFSGPDGASGTSGNQWVKLDNVGNDFQPGAEDTYEVEGNLNGPITDVSLALDGSDEWRPEASKWHFSSVPTQSASDKWILTPGSGPSDL